MTMTAAMQEDTAEIMGLYRAAMGTNGCTWSDDYPTEEILQQDYTDHRLYCLKTDAGEIIGAISIDDDPIVDALEIWDKNLEPVAELARIVVRDTYRGQGIAGRMVAEMMEELHRRGYKGVHFLVSRTNERAIRAYAGLNFHNIGNVDLFGEHWMCYERPCVSEQ